ncbi:hypothetical protein A1O3_00157 [Capronia epimyces CBS 606.96]|uniref:Aminoglycoside phosphotransferase domain-containing protein n=1 Tax=Capronia epimyces CBS 606.96 TaxID=1182542 RepID=W9ZAQ9_9EURO|nr:uncharacterized protein A1O3_00157 [Capronia epimyces CBS 606.96]EXJ91609.1 hypothetical protein A1O3_00157 [Capronia epimyces CBS 606.96]
MPTFERIISLFLRARLWLGKKRYPTFLGPSVVRVSKTRLIKGPCQSPELEGLRYVAQHTSIPVPKVHRTYRVDGCLYIEMEYIPGNTLQAAWIGNTLSPEEKQAIVQELAAYIDQLRALEPSQKEVVASAELGPCLDYRVGFDSFGEGVTRCHTRQYRSCFSHADLCARNVIVRDRKIAAIVDWQFAGWYPEYWEYTKAHYGLLNMPDWYSEFKDVVTRYDDELDAEHALWERLNQPGEALRMALEDG